MQTLIIIFIYGIILIIFYVLVIRRLKILSKGHLENTGIVSLANGYKIVKRRIIIALIILFVLSCLVIITFFNDELLYQGGLYNNQETLDSISL